MRVIQTFYFPSFPSESFQPLTIHFITVHFHISHNYSVNCRTTVTPTFLHQSICLLLCSEPSPFDFVPPFGTTTHHSPTSNTLIFFFPVMPLSYSPVPYFVFYLPHSRARSSLSSPLIHLYTPLPSSLSTPHNILLSSNFPTHIHSPFVLSHFQTIHHFIFLISSHFQTP